MLIYSENYARVVSFELKGKGRICLINIANADPASGVKKSREEKRINIGKNRGNFVDNWSKSALFLPMWSWENVWLSRCLAVKTKVTRKWVINLHGFEVTDLSIIGVTYFTSSPLRFHVDNGGGITISDVLQFWEGDRSHDLIKISYQLLVKLSSFLKYSLTLKYKC